jgi:prolipoprotein diacylglyceryl transferase
MNLAAVVWNTDPEIVQIGALQIRWYGLLFAMSFFFGYIIINKFFKKEGFASELLDSLTIYMAVGTIVGARLGHCLFYEPDYFLSHPIEILYVHKGGLASHGAAIGILIALIFFVRKHKRPYLWILDRVVVVVALAGFFIRTGNLMNSEIYGEATNSKSGFVYLQDYPWEPANTNYIEKVKLEKIKNAALFDEKYIPMKLRITFGEDVQNEEQASQYMRAHLEARITQRVWNRKEANVYYPPDERFNYTINKNSFNQYEAILSILALPKHPTQIYEAVSYFLIFLLLMWLYYRKKGNPNQGMLFGLFLILVFTARFFIEFLKEVQVGFENDMILNMGQWLSIPFVIGGFVMLLLSFRSASTQDS